MISGLLSAVMVLSAAVTPATAFASEMIPEEELKAYVEALPELDQVKEQLDPEEIVTAKDYEVDFDAEIDLKKDFTNLEIPDKEKVNVKFYEAKDSDQAEFSTGRAGTYKAVYYVEPANEQHPVYRISRNITVKEPVTESQTDSSSSDDGGSGESGDAEDPEADPDPEAQTLMVPEGEPVEMAASETSATETTIETEDAHIIYEFTEEAYELEMAAAEETAQAMEEAENTEVQDAESRPAETVPETDAEAEETDAEAETPSAAEEPESQMESSGQTEEAAPAETAESETSEPDTVTEEPEAAPETEDPAMIVVTYIRPSNRRVDML